MQFCTSYRKLQASINRQLSIEKQAFVKLEQAQKHSEKAASLAEDIFSTQSTLQEAQLNCQTALNLLSTVPAGTSIYSDAQQRLSLYRSGCNNIAQQLEQVKKTNSFLSNY